MYPQPLFRWLSRKDAEMHLCLSTACTMRVSSVSGEAWQVCSLHTSVSVVLLQGLLSKLKLWYKAEFLNGISGGFVLSSASSLSPKYQ